MITNKILLEIHDAIHDNNIKFVKIHETVYPVKIDDDGLRSIRYQGITFIEQDPAHKTPLAQLAKLGEKITWGKKLGGDWILIINNEVKQK